MATPSEGVAIDVEADATGAVSGLRERAFFGFGARLASFGSAVRGCVVARALLDVALDFGVPASFRFATTRFFFLGREAARAALVDSRALFCRFSCLRCSQKR